MLNHITIMGRMTRDPELRRTGSGVAVASFTLAVDRDFGKSENGERETDFIDCNAWRGTGEFIARNFHKGKKSAEDNSPYQPNYGSQTNQNPYAETDALIAKYSAQGAHQSEFAMLEGDDTQFPF